MHREDEVLQTGVGKETLKESAFFDDGTLVGIASEHGTTTNPYEVVDRDEVKRLYLLRPVHGTDDDIIAVPMSRVVVAPDADDPLPRWGRHRRTRIPAERKVIAVMDAGMDELDIDASTEIPDESEAEELVSAPNPMGGIAVELATIEKGVPAKLTIEVEDAEIKEAPDILEASEGTDTPEGVHEQRADSDMREQTYKTALIKKEIFDLIPEIKDKVESSYYEIDEQFEALLTRVQESIAAVEDLKTVVSEPGAFKAKADTLRETVSQLSLELHQCAIIDLQALLDRVDAIKKALYEQKRFASQQDAAAFEVARDKGVPTETIQRATDAIDDLSSVLEPFTRQAPQALSTAQTFAEKLYRVLSNTETEVKHVSDVLLAEDVPDVRLDEDELNEFIDRRSIGYAEAVDEIAAELKRVFGEDVEDHRELISKMKASIQNAIAGLSMAYATRKPEEEQRP